MPIKREPAAVAGVVAAVLVLLLVYGVMDEAQAAAWGGLAAAVVPLVQAWWTRRQVVPVETVMQAGLDPAQVQRAADDPEVQPYIKEGQ